MGWCGSGTVGERVVGWWVDGEKGCPGALGVGGGCGGGGGGGGEGRGGVWLSGGGI